jgi:formamidopyrimidine-DNA glycosylase
MNKTNNSRITEILKEELVEDLELNDDEVAVDTSDKLIKIEEEELTQEQQEAKEILKDEVFEKLKIALLEESRLIGRFYEFCEEHTHFEYDEMGMNMEEGEDILRKADKIRDKFLNIIEEKLLYIFDNIETNSITRMITFDLDAKEFQYRVVIEVFQDSFNLEIH